jgi:hypothetical protein
MRGHQRGSRPLRLILGSENPVRPGRATGDEGTPVRNSAIDDLQYQPSKLIIRLDDYCVRHAGRARRPGGQDAFSGMIEDPRTCPFDDGSIVCARQDSPSCFTEQQATVANQLWRGPVDENGMFMSPGDLPYGSELAWAGAVALARRGGIQPGYVERVRVLVRLPELHEHVGCHRDHEQEHPVHQSGVPAVGHHARAERSNQSGSPRICRTWRDAAHVGGLDGPGYIAVGTLNYYDAVRKLMGASSASGFHVVVPHSRRLPLCGWPGGCHVRFSDPLISWVEDRQPPGATVVS